MSTPAKPASSRGEVRGEQCATTGVSETRVDGKRYYENSTSERNAWIYSQLMQAPVGRGSRWERWRAPLLVLTLISSAVHFADNAFHLELYPGPAWLTRNIVLSAWLAVLTAAYVVYRLSTRWALVAYATLGFAGLAHYWMPHRVSLPLRCTLTIGAEAATSVMLIVYALLQPRADQTS